MNTALEKNIVKQQNKFNSLPRKFDVCWAMDFASNKSVMFEVLNVDLQCGQHRSHLLSTIQPGMFVKISVDWVSREHMNESFWVEITNINVDVFGEIHLFGTCANNTERVAYGSVIGPIYLRNILKVEE